MGNMGASGQIISETLASSLPTVIVYVIDTPRCVSPVTFVSNMLYACSIMYKSRLPFVLAFNKIDVISHQFAIDWMSDYDGSVIIFCSSTAAGYTITTLQHYNDASRQLHS